MKVIQSFESGATHRLFVTGTTRHWSNIKAVALRKLDQLDSAITLDDLRAPPGNRLEPLKADRKGQHSIRINDQWRICFVWRHDGPHNVEIVDYH